MYVTIHLPTQCGTHSFIHYFFDMSVIGLDFGCHTASIALWHAEKDITEVIADDLGLRTIPVAVAFRGDEIITGIYLYRSLIYLLIRLFPILYYHYLLTHVLIDLLVHLIILTHSLIHLQDYQLFNSNIRMQLIPLKI